MAHKGKVGFGGLRGRYLPNCDRDAEAKVSRVLNKASQTANDDADADADADDGPITCNLQACSCARAEKDVVQSHTIL